MEGEANVERRRSSGLWVHWVGDAVSLAVVLAVGFIGYGELKEANRQEGMRLEKVEAKVEAQQRQSNEDRREMKNDIQRELQNLVTSIGAIDSKLTAILVDRPRK